MAHRFFTLWDRMVESGIRDVMEQRSVSAYKSIRSKFIERHMATTNDEPTVESIGSELILLLLIMGIGYSLGVAMFVLECLLFN